MVQILKEKATETEQIEEAQIELRGPICCLSEEFLRELCTELHIELKEKDTGCLALIQIVTKYLDAEELDIKKLKELRVVVEQKDRQQRLKVILMTNDVAAMQKSDMGASASVLDKFLP